MIYSNSFLEINRKDIYNERDDCVNSVACSNKDITSILIEDYKLAGALREQSTTYNEFENPIANEFFKLVTSRIDLEVEDSLSGMTVCDYLFDNETDLGELVSHLITLIKRDGLRKKILMDSFIKIIEKDRNDIRGWSVKYLINKLVEMRADFSRFNQNNENLIHRLAWNNNLNDDLLDFLFSQSFVGSSLINQTNSFGNTPLHKHFSCKEYNRKFIALMIEKKASLNILNLFNQTPKDIFLSPRNSEKRSRNKEIILLIL